MSCKNQCCCCMKQYIDMVVSNIGLKSFQAQLSLKPSLQLTNGGIVPFNEVLVANPLIITPNLDGSFTALKSGTYNVSYFVNIDGSDGVINFVFKVNGVPSQSNLVQGQLNGFTTLSLAAGDVISLTSNNQGIVALGANNIQAGIMITTI